MNFVPLSNGVHLNLDHVRRIVAGPGSAVVYFAKDDSLCFQGEPMIAVLKIERKKPMKTVCGAIIVAAAVTVSANAADKPTKEEPPAKIKAFLEEREVQAKKLKLPRGPKRDAFLPELSTKPAVGQIGLMSDPTITVVDVVDAKNMIVDATYVHDQVVARNNRLANKTTTYHKTLWLRGIETANYADGAKVEIDGLMEVTGTEGFETEDGGNETLLVIEPFDRAQLDPYLPPPKKKSKRRSTPKQK